MDFKWAMQERIDAGMNPNQAYNETRDSYTEFSDLKNLDRIDEDSYARFDCDCRNVCSCICDVDCECKNSVNEALTGLAIHESMQYS